MKCLYFQAVNYYNSVLHSNNNILRAKILQKIFLQLLTATQVAQNYFNICLALILQLLFYLVCVHGKSSTTNLVPSILKKSG